jgi:YHS domain-containing protein
MVKILHRRKNMLKQWLSGVLFALVLSGLAQAGEQYVDPSGYAVSGYDVVAYHSLSQSPVGKAQPKAVRGKLAYTTDYNGAKWAFSSEENLQAFMADPARYAPQYDGHCAFGIFKGGKVPGNPHLWRIVDGKLYLNITQPVVGFWEEDISGHITKADQNWTELEQAAASDEAIPQYQGPVGPEKM